MKNSQLSKKDLKKVRGGNFMSVFSWAAFLAMMCVICISILWETFNSSYKQGKSLNKTYVYPEFVLDFQTVIKEREELLHQYKHDLQLTGVERRSNLSLQEFWDLYDAKW